MNLDGKTAVVTGAGGGMGLQVARSLVDAGARVTMIDLKPRPDGFDDESVLFCQGDLVEENFVRDAMQQTEQRFGGLDYLVNTAGVLWFGRDGSILDMDLDVWDEVLRINLRSVVHTVRHAVPIMQRTGGGAMVHVSSTQALRGDDKPQDAYQASKAAIIALSKTFAIKFAPDSIRSNVLIPGPTDTPMQSRWSDNPAGRTAMAEVIPLGRVGTAADMANACVFLLSDNASFITGTELIVDGGLLARP